MWYALQEEVFIDLDLKYEYNISSNPNLLDPSSDAFKDEALIVQQEVRFSNLHLNWKSIFYAL